MKNLFVVLLLLSAMAVSQDTFAQEMPELDKSPMDMAYYPSQAAFRAFEKDAGKQAALQPVMRIIYSRPQAKGREVMGNLIKMGEVWRMGANENAELNVFQEVTLAGQKLEPGRYSLHVIPGEEEWTLAINSDLDNWGSYAYQEANDIARVKGKVATTENQIEAFTCTFTEDALIMAWENTMVSFPVSQ